MHDMTLQTSVRVRLVRHESNQLYHVPQYNKKDRHNANYKLEHTQTYQNTN